MKQLLSFLFALALTVSVAWAQTEPPQIDIPAFKVTPSGSAVFPADPIIIGDEGLAEVPVIWIDITADSADVRIDNLRLNISRSWTSLPGQLGIKSIDLYEGSTLIAVKVGDQSDSYLFEGLDFFLPAYGQKTLSLRLSGITGDGEIVPWIDWVSGTVPTTGQSHSSFATVWGARLNFVNPEKTTVAYQRSPINADQDTLFVYPGQYWYLSESYYTDPHNWLPGIITAANVTANTKLDATRQEPEFYTQYPYIHEDSLGEFYYDESSSNSVLAKWYSKYSSGVSGLEGFNRWGTNQMAAGKMQWLWSSAEIVYYSPFFNGWPRSRFFNSSVCLKCVDGIRGDIDGDSLVTQEDFDRMVAGQMYRDQMYHHNRVDFGRGLVLFNMATTIDTWLVRVWLNTPDDLLVKDLGIGKLMSEGRVSPKPQSFTTETIGNTISITTKAFAVNVSTVLPDGKVWNQAVLVSNGKANIELPDTKLKYHIEAVSLPNKTTGVGEQTDIPTEFRLGQNYPNPFNPTTTIEYSLPQAGMTSIAVYNVLGQEVMLLLNKEMPAGTHRLQIDASRLTSGTYFYRIASGSFVSTKKMVLMK